MLTSKSWRAACLVTGLSMAVPFASALGADVTFSLGWIPAGRSAPWYAAIEKGYFKEEGLNVKIIPGKGAAQVAQAIASGIADLGYVGILGVALAYTKGVDLKILTVNYQKSPYTIFSFAAGANVTKPSQLEGLTLASSATSYSASLIRGFMAERGLDPAKLMVTNVAPSARTGLFMSKKVQSVENFILAQPFLERISKMKKRKLITFMLGDHGLQLYGNGIVGTAAYIKANPEVVRGFVRAGLRGWRFTLRNPSEAADMQLRHIGTLKKGAILKEIGILRRVAISDDVKAHGLGWFDPAKMKASLDFLVKNVAMKGRTPVAKDLYLTEFLPKTPIKP